jgi:hypothetical protein
MPKPSLTSLAKRLAAIEFKRQPPKPKAFVVVGEHEAIEAAKACWLAEHPGEAPEFTIIVSGIPGNDAGLKPDPDKCTRESVLAAVPAVKAHLARWSENGVSAAVERVAQHWTELCQRFQIEE